MWLIFYQKIKIDIVVKDEMVDSIINTIVNSAKLGKLEMEKYLFHL